MQVGPVSTPWKKKNKAKQKEKKRWHCTYGGLILFHIFLFSYNYIYTIYSTYLFRIYCGDKLYD